MCIEGNELVARVEDAETNRSPFKTPDVKIVENMLLCRQVYKSTQILREEQMDRL